MPQIAIYPKEVALFLGVSERTAQKIHQKIKELYKLEKHQYISIKMFCAYTGLEEEQVHEGLNPSSKK